MSYKYYIFQLLTLKKKQKDSRHSGWFLKKKVYFTLQDFLLAVATCNR